METFFLIVLLGLIHCQSLNETVSRSFEPPDEELSHKFINGTQSESLNFHFPEGRTGQDDAPHEFEFEARNGEEPQAAPSTTLSRIVQTKYGKVQGLSLTLFSNYGQKVSNHPLRNKIVEVFLSIPYASPPVKSHRFSPTQTALPWHGVRKAVKPGTVCPQVMPDIRDEGGALKDMPRGYLDYLRRVEPHLRNQSEDCLYLNIFAPATTLLTSPDAEPRPKLRPVLVFIHGGKFSWGSGNLMDGSILAVAADVLVVTINYRLGVLGFLNVNPSPLTKPRVANYGLMDQIAALHWIKENVAAFGGEPESITLMGYESGAASIHFLMSSPAVMKGLFHRAILIAGSSQAPWALVQDPAAVANALAETLNCSSISSVSSSTFHSQSGHSSHNGTGKPLHTPDSLFDCLKNKHFSYFSKFHPPKFSVDFGPSVDGIVIRPDFKGGNGPDAQMGKRDLSPKYDLLFGVSSLEMLTVFSEADLAFGFEAQRRDAILRTLVRNSYRFHLNEILATITNEYIDWERSPQHPIATRDLTLNALTDCLSLAPVISVSESPNANKSYFYVFDHSTKEGLYNYPQKIGPGGGEEINYFFGYPMLENGHGIPFYPTLIPANYTRAEVALSELMVTHLSNFIHSGDPNEPIKPESTWPISKERNKYRSLQWEPYDRLHQKYLELTGNKVRTRTHFRAHQMAIWRRLVPELQRSGSQYASVLHNRLRGGYNPLLYVGSLHLPMELEGALDPGSALEGEIGDFYNGTGIPPSPPTTCYSPLSSLASESASRGVGLDPAASAASGSSRTLNETARKSGSSTFSPYTTALSLAIAIGCSFLILNVFIFALVYYRRDKKRIEEMMRRGGGRRSLDEEQDRHNPATEEDELRNYGEPPELLKSNTTTATSFHQSLEGTRGKPQQGLAEEGVELNYGLRSVLAHQPPPCFYNDVNDMIPSVQEHGPHPVRTHKEVHFSPRSPSRTSGSTVRQLSSGTPASSSQFLSNQFQSQEVLGIVTLPRQEHNQTSTETNHVGTLPKKPVPPTRNLTNYTISQRQIFSLIMSLMTIGIL